MWLVGVKLTLFNVPILPAILGIGVDNAVYLGAAIGSLPRNRTRADVRVVIGHTGQAIFYATTTTIVGFGAFLVADSGGLRSIGALAVIGIATAAASAFIVLPTASVWRSSLK